MVAWCSYPRVRKMAPVELLTIAKCDNRYIVPVLQIRHRITSRTVIDRVPVYLSVRCGGSSAYPNPSIQYINKQQD